MFELGWHPRLLPNKCNGVLAAILSHASYPVLKRTGAGGLRQVCAPTLHPLLRNFAPVLFNCRGRYRVCVAVFPSLTATRAPALGIRVASSWLICVLLMPLHLCP